MSFLSENLIKSIDIFALTSTVDEVNTSELKQSQVKRHDL